ncbi:MAG: AMP-binding protein [Acidobacteriota bacterium]|nr:AMP-binding protein [Acidobacteriota bacterium]
MRESLLEFLYENAENDRDVAFAFKRKLRGERWSYAETARTAFQFARELEQRGIGKGDSVVIWGENRAEWVAAFFGVLLRGAVVVPLDEQSAPDFVLGVCEQTKPKLLLRGTQIDSIDLNLPEIAIDDFRRVVGVHSKENYQPQNVSRSDLAEIVFTSGTTAQPKGVCLTHENILANVEVLESAIKKYQKYQFLAHPLRILNLLPLSHVFGQVMGIFVPPLLRAEVHFLNHFNPSEIIETIRRERILVLATVPRVLETLRGKIERDFESTGKLDSFRREIAEAERWSLLKKWWRFRRIRRQFGFRFLTFVTGGATLNEETEIFWRRLGYAVAQGYGMTETAALVALNNPFKSRRGSLGEILRGQEIRIDESGEILVRGKNISPGYFGGNQKPTDDGWLRTGDIGAIDETGRLYFKGRKKDVIVTAAGLNVYPGDLESALNRQPEIKDSAVVGIETEQGTEAVAALILQSGDAAKAVASANKTLASHQQIRRFVVWTEADFPRTATQKIKKNEIAEFVRRNLGNNVAKTGQKTSILGDVLARVKGGKIAAAIGAEMRLSEDLNLDSLGRVELLSAIEERYQVDLDEQAFTAATTVGDIETMVQTGKSELNAPRFSYPRWSLTNFINILRILFYYAVPFPITWILCPMKVRGRERLKDVKTPVIIASNHVTYIDPAIILAALPHSLRSRTAIAMDGERLKGYRFQPKNAPFYKKAWFYFQYWALIFVFNVFPLPKRSGFRRSFEYAGGAMDKGYNILIFPEGELTKTGNLQKFQTGFGLLANGLETTIVPVYLAGLYELRARGQRGYAPAETVSVIFGEPVQFDANQTPQQIASQIESRIAELADLS